MNRIQSHPVFTHAQDIIDICSPLNTLGITYFSHVIVNQNNEFSGLGNNPKFAEHYLEKKYYNADIHLAKNTQLGKDVLWDNVPVTKESEQLYKDSILFGVNHTFTIIKKQGDISHFYHFANASPDKSINQVYLNNYDLLEIFIDFFHSKVDDSPELKECYEQTFTIDKKIAEYSIDESQIQQLGDRSKFITEIKKHHPILCNIINLSPKELLCLELYAQGKTAKLIGKELNLSQRTIETHLANAKEKLQTHHKSDLIEKFNLLRKNLR